MIAIQNRTGILGTGDFSNSEGLTWKLNLEDKYLKGGFVAIKFMRNVKTHTDTGAFSSIFDIGVKMNRDNSLTLDNQKFEESIKKGYSDVAGLFTGEKGLATTMNNMLDNYTGYDGISSSIRESFQNRIDQTEDSLLAYEERMDRYEERLRSQFAGLDNQLSNMQVQGDRLSTVLNNL